MKRSPRSAAAANEWPLIAAFADLEARLGVATEMVRLVHTPALDAFRLTLAGALLLGRVFSWWNILAYAIGIAAAVPFRMALMGSAGRTG